MLELEAAAQPCKTTSATVWDALYDLIAPHVFWESVPKKVHVSWAWTKLLLQAVVHPTADANKRGDVGSVQAITY